MNSNNAFAKDYDSARSRFRRLSLQATDSLAVHPVSDPDDDLSIDVAEFGDPQARRTLVISSGLHGVEGFVGSAIQARLIEKLISGGFPKGCSLVLIHAINPYGFKHLRRVNEDNIDLNRNFLVDFNQKPTASGYARFHALLNPESRTRGIDLFTLKACCYIMRHGLRPLRDSIAAGQYEFPRGLFYGGRQAAESTKIISDLLVGLSSNGNRLFHIDIHSGLGRYADYRLLLSAKQAPGFADRLVSNVDTRRVEFIGQNNGMTGSITGTICDYFGEMIGADYQHLGLEFGTYSNLKILIAMRSENAAHHYMDHAERKRAKAALRNCFCPQDQKWRIAVLSKGLWVIDRALNLMRGR